MAGTIAVAGSQQFNEHGGTLGGGKVWIIAAGTTSDPQDAFYDSALTQPLPYPITLDAAGRCPYFFLDDGFVKVRITDANGVTQFVQDGVLVVGPSSGGGGGGGVDPTTVFQTGDCLWLDIQGTRTGWVRDNGRTIGSASSGATERANADTSALFVYLWNTFSNTICPVSTGRGANAAADFAANKTITMPDKRGYVPGGLDDMGNSAASRWTGAPVVSGDVITAGSVLGEVTHTLSTSEIPSHDHAVFLNDPGHTHTHASGSATGAGSNGLPVTGPGSLVTGSSTTGITIWSGASGTGNQNKVAATGGGGVHNNVQKTVLGSFFRKL